MDYATTHAQLKLLSEAGLPDPRWEYRFTYPATGIEWLHHRITPIRLHAGVPKVVQTQFETARNLMLYAWFVYEFQTVAEMQVFATLDHALKLRLAVLDKKSPGLAGLLRSASKKGFLLEAREKAHARMCERQRGQWPGSQPSPVTPPGEWFQQIVDSIPDSRNYLAHGGPQLDLTTSLSHLELCADLINSLFPVSDLNTANRQ